MVEYTALNMTSSALSNLGSWSSIGWLTTLLVFGFIILTLFLIFRNFRRVIYGGVVSGILLIIYKVSRWIGVSTQEKDYIPIKWFGYIVGFIILSYFIGIIIERLKLIKKLEEKFK